MRKTRKILSLLLCLVMMTSLLPATGAADAGSVYPVVLAGMPENTGIAVYAGGDRVEAGEDGVYWLPAGSYSYTAICEGYLPAENVPFTVENGPIEIAVDLQPLAQVHTQLMQTGDENAAAGQSTEIAVDSANFPDYVFRAYVSAQFDKDRSGSLSANEIAAATQISVVAKGIASLKGVEHFTALTKLNCSNNLLTSLDVTQNTALVWLQCYNNQLTGLNVSRNTALTWLNCYYNQLTSLDVSQNAALTYLDCYNNCLTSLDVRSNPQLKRLQLDRNRLTSLDLSGNPALNWLKCSQNQLGSLAIYSNPILLQTVNEYSPRQENGVIIYGLVSGSYVEIDAGTSLIRVDLENLVINSENFPDDAFRAYVSAQIDKNGNGKLGPDEIAAVTQINVSNRGITTLKGLEYFTELTSLNCSGNQLTSLDVSNVGLTSLDVSNNQLLTTLDCSNNHLTSLQLTGNSSLAVLRCGGNQLSALVVSGCPALTTLDCSNNRLSDLYLEGDKALTVLRCAGNALSVLDASLCPALTTLDCARNQLTSLDIGQNPALAWLKCSGNQLRSLSILSNPILLQTVNSYPASKVGGIVSYGTVDGSYIEIDINTRLVTVDLENIAINSVNFPDDAFRAYVSAQFDKDGSGTLSSEETAAVTQINVMNKGITTLKGVEYFTELTSLNCSRNQLTSLDVRNGKLTSLNVGNNPALTTLDCSNNQLTTLSLSETAALTALRCGDNQLSVLNFSLNLALTDLDCSNNQVTNLVVRKNSELITLNCSNNQLTSLNLGSSSGLSTLICSSNQLTELDLSPNPALGRLICSNNQMSTLSIRNNPVLVQALSDGFASERDGVISIGIGGETVIECDADIKIAAGGPLVIAAASFPDTAFRAYLKEKHDTNKNGVLSVAEIDGVTEIDAPSRQIQSLVGVDVFAKLEVLNCSGNQLTQLWLTNNKALKELDCSGNQLTALYLDSSPALTAVNCSHNLLTSLSLPTVLLSLDCSNNRLTSLSVMWQQALENLICDGNQLTSLDVRQNYALKTLRCADNQLKHLDVHVSEALRELDCSNNQLPFLDVRYNLMLETLNGANNQMTFLYVYNTVALRTLDCTNNKLGSLDLSDSTALSNLRCSANSISRLDISANPILVQTVNNNPSQESNGVKSYGTVGGNYVEVDSGTTLVVSKPQSTGGIKTTSSNGGSNPIVKPTITEHRGRF